MNQNSLLDPKLWVALLNVVASFLIAFGVLPSVEAGDEWIAIITPFLTSALGLIAFIVAKGRVETEQFRVQAQIQESRYWREYNATLPPVAVEETK